MPESPTVDYISYLLTTLKFPPVSLLSFFFLALFRIAPIVSLAPFLGAKLPRGVKMGLALSLAIIMLPHVVGSSREFVYFNIAFVGLAFKELLVGFIMAFFITVPFYIAQSSGTIIDFVRGSSSMMVTDPSTRSQISPIGLMYNYMLIIIFFYIGGAFYFFDALLQSFTYLPVDRVVSPLFFASGFPLWKTLFELMTRILALAIQFAAPALVAVLMAEVFLGIANRLAPQVQIAFLGMSIKSLLAIALLFAAWMFILKQLGQFSLNWLIEYKKLIYYFSQ